jgi:hypothetical protein
MSLRHVPATDLIPNVTRLRHVELPVDLVYVGQVDGYVLARADGDVKPHPVHIDDVEILSKEG